MKQHVGHDTKRKGMKLITTTSGAVHSQLREQKYTLILADQFSFAPELATARQKLWSDWDNLALDNYLRHGGRFRQRRFGLFYLLPSAGEVLPLPSAPYIQSREVNMYAGGIAREFAPLLEDSLTNQFLHELIKFNFRQFPVDNSLADQAWEIDVHQFRVVASQNEQGEPTPEGIHHDGDDFNCIHLIGRYNVAGGVNSIYDNSCNLLASYTLDRPMDSIIVWDPYVMHGVSPIHPKDPNKPAIRDVLVLGYNYRPELKRPKGIP